MNTYLKRFIKGKFKKTGKALDLGAGDFSDIADLKKSGWQGEGVDIKTGVDLEKFYLSKNKPFDLVYSNYVLQKLKNKEQLIKTAYENLKTSGWLFIHTFDKSDANSNSDITADSLKKLLAERGFKNMAITIFDHYDVSPGHKHWHKILEAKARK